MKKCSDPDLNCCKFHDPVPNMRTVQYLDQHHWVKLQRFSRFQSNIGSARHVCVKIPVLGFSISQVPVPGIIFVAKFKILDFLI